MTQLIDKIAKTLYEGKRMTTKDISLQFGTDIDYTRQTVKRLHRARQVHICGWAASTCGGAAVPVWMWGDAFDAEEPKSTGEEGVRRIERCSYRTIAKLRTSFVPGQFDPFRVLCAQVAR